MPAGRKFKLYSGSRKTATATAAVMQGTGKIRVNKVPVEILTPRIARERIATPLEIAGELRDRVDIDVTVKGGGVMGQAEAATVAIARALVGHVRGADLRKRFTEYDKHLLSGDARRTEPKKFGGSGARTRKQKSYR